MDLNPLLPFLHVRRAMLRLLVLVLMAALPTVPLTGLLGPGVAFADDAPKSSRQKVLILRADGSGVTDPQRQVVTKEINAQAQRYKALDIVLSNAELTEEMFEFECTEPGVECLARIGNKYQAQLVVYSELAKNPSGQLQINLRVIDVAQGRVAQSTVQPLENADKPTQAAQRGLVVLLGPVDMPNEAADATGTLEIKLQGGGVALIYVDDRLVGRTTVAGLKTTVAAGAHTLKVVRAGFKEWTGRVTIAPGAITEQQILLEQTANVSGPNPFGSGAVRPVSDAITGKWWFWTAVGVGVIAVGVASYYLLKPADAVKTGTLAVSLDDTEAYKDPVFGGTAK